MMGAVRAEPHAGTSVGAATSRFYVYLSLWMWVLAIGGFGPGLVEQIAAGTWLSMPLVVHMHAIVYLGWLALFTYQVSLPGSGRVEQHRKLGKYLAGYAILMVVVGITVMLSRFAERVAGGQLELAQAVLIHPLTDMFVFPTLFGLAVYFRRLSATHKRLMVTATTMLLIAAVGRMGFLGNPPNILLYDLLWLSPIWVAMIRDAVVYRRLHPAYGISLVLLAVLPMRVLLVNTGPYQAFTTWLAGVL